MRVLLSCLQSVKRHPIPAYDFWRQYFVEGCREAGIDFVEVPGVDWAEGLLYSGGNDLQSWLARSWDLVLAFARREQNRQPIDFFLGYLYPTQIEPRAIVDLQNLGIPCVNFFCDNVREFRCLPEEFRPFALHWVPEFEALPLYRQGGLPHVHAPMPCWVPPKYRCVPTAEVEPPTFIGSADILRRDLLGAAAQAGADFVVRGPGWSHQAQPNASAPAKSQSLAQMVGNQVSLARTHGLSALCYKLANRLCPLRPVQLMDRCVCQPVWGEEYARVTREARVTLGVNRVPTSFSWFRRPVVYSRLRDIEAPMLGACYLTEWTAGLCELYELGTEIESYRTPEELRAKLCDLINDDVRRRLLRERGQKRALADHSVARTLMRIARKVTGHATI